MSWSFVLASARKDLRRRLRDPLALALWMGIPLVIGSLLVLASGGFGGGDDETPRAHVLVADQDDSFLSGLLVGAMSSEQARVFRVEQVEAEAGRARLDRGDGSALLVIPAGFGEALLLEEPSVLTLVTNPAQRIMPGLVEETLSLLVDGSFYLHRLLGDEVREIARGPLDGAVTFPDATVAELSTRINERMRGLERWLFPPVIELNAVSDEPAGEDQGQDGDPVTMGTIFFPTMLFMALFFVAQGQSEDVWLERAQGTLRRAVTTPPRVGALFLGKILAAGVISAGVVAAGLVVGWASFGLSPSGSLVALAWAVVAGIGLTLLMTLLQLFATSQRGGSLITNVVLFPLLMIGGCFFPFEAMPDWMASIGRFTPNGFALVEFKWLLGGGFELGRLARDLALAALFCGLLFAACSRRFATGFARAA